MLLCFSTTEACLNCLLSARIRSGDGGPSMAGSIMSLIPRVPRWKLRLGETGGDTAVLGGSAAAFRRPLRPTVWPGIKDCIMFRAYKPR